MNRIETFFAYMGNKSEIAEWIIPLFPAHKGYIEVFGGTGSILLNKPPSKVEFYNDLNPHLSNLFEVTRSKKDEFIEMIKQVPIDEKLYNYFYDNHADYSDYPNVENAVRYFYIMCLAYMGKYTGGFKWEYDASFKYTFEAKVHVLEKIHARVKNVVILNKSYDKIIDQFKTKKDALLYLDPPYVNTEGYYKFLAGEFQEKDHIILRDKLAEVNGFFFLSYEDDELVNDLYSRAGFYFLRKNKVRRGQKSQGGKGVATEVIVTNYQEPNTLFSYAELGGQPERLGETRDVELSDDSTN